MGQHLSKKRSQEEMREFILSKGISDKTYNERREIFLDYQDGKERMSPKEFKTFVKDVLKALGLEKQWKAIKQILPGIFALEDANSDQVGSFHSLTTNHQKVITCDIFAGRRLPRVHDHLGCV